MREKLTDTGVRAYQPRPTAYAIGDVACPGLRLRITSNGVKTFAFAYRNKGAGKTAWLTLGRYPDIQLATARELANDARKTVALGGTPMAPKAKAAEAEKKTKTYAKVVDLYFDAKLIALRSGRKTRGTLHRIGREYGWSDRPASSITDDDAAHMLHDIAIRRGKKPMANQTKHLAHAMFKWAKQPGRRFVAVNPFADLPAPGGAIVKRERFLSADEIRQVWAALNNNPERFEISRDAATALRLILATAARPGMVRGMVGTELRDLRGPSKHGPHWSLPAKRMKAGSAFITPLSGLAVELLRPHLKANPNAPVFQLRRDELQKAARRLVAELGMDRWTPHDLRRTAATILDRSGYLLEEIGAILAHTRKGVTAIYARWGKFDLKREMAMVIERSLRETLDNEPVAIVDDAA
jgi:integrase